jgi:hypothetical protein
LMDGSIIEQGTITTDPQFVNYQSNGSGDYHLKSTSPGVDAGVSTNAPSIDIDGATRPQGNGIDIGPYESGGSSTISPNPTSVVPSFVCGGSQNCVGTPSPTISIGGGTPAPSLSLSTAPNTTVFPTNAVINGTQPPVSSVTSTVPSLSVPSTGGDSQSLIEQLIKLIQMIIQLLQQLHIGGSGSHHTHHGHHNR